MTAPQTGSPDLTLVVPCYNEETHLRESVRTVLSVLDRSELSYEVVFVDDGSADGTREIVREICERSPQCRYLFHEQNRGRGAAFKTGFAAGEGRVTGFIDIDLEVHASYIPELVRLVLHERYDVVTGHRHDRLLQTHRLMRLVASWFYRWMLGALIMAGIKDTETGCKFFNRKTAGPVVLASENDHWFWDTEVMVRAVLANLRVKEVPVLFLRRMDKKSTVRLLRDSWLQLVALHRFRAKVGLSLLNKSPLYWTGLGYDKAMALLQGREHLEVYRDVAERIAPGASVVDLCAGTCQLYRRFLKAKGCEYLGLDFNGHFVIAARRRGVNARFFNLLTEEVPAADYVVMTLSFYHFHSRAPEIFDKLRRAARVAVILQEPIRNLATHSLVGSIFVRLTNPGVGDYDKRFDLDEFRAFAERHGATEFVHPPGARNALAVFEARIT